MANYLGDEQDIVAYLQVVMEDGDPALLASALSREQAPSTDTLFKVLRALGFKLTVQPRRRLELDALISCGTARTRSVPPTRRQS